MLQVGSKLSGRYRIDGVLGQGGMGAVYQGCLESLGNKRVAIKEMEVPFSNEATLQQAVEQFKKEATFLAHLDHPNLVKVTDFFTEGNKHYLVMEHVDGETLQARLERLGRPLEWSELNPWAQSLAEVLHYLHSQDPAILFRDLKPANVMIDKNGRLKLIDFGIARTAQPGTETSTFLKGTGTNGFSPIEQYGMGESTDHRSDIYSFGATLYYLLTGKIPPEAIARVSSNKRLIVPSTANPKLNSSMDKFLERCLAIRQDERYQTMEQVLRHLGKLETGLTEELKQSGFAGEAPKATPAITVEMFPSVTTSEKNSSAPWAAALAVLGVAAAVMMAVFVHFVRGLDQDKVAEQPAPTASLESSVREQPAPTPSHRAMVTREPAPTQTSRMEEPEVRVVTRVPVERPVAQPVAATTVKAEAKPKPRVAPSLGGGPAYPTSNGASSEKKPAATAEQPPQYPTSQGQVSGAQPPPPPPARPAIRPPLDPQARARLQEELRKRREGLPPGQRPRRPLRDRF